MINLLEMDEQLIIYLILIALGLISSLFKKKKKERTLNEEERDSSVPEMTFEDLLEEFQGRRKNTAQSQAKPEVEEVRPIERKEEKVKQFVDEDIDNVYQQAIKEADKKPRSFSDARTRLEHFESYDQQEEETNDWAKEVRESLASPDTAAKAIILSEIINRKYD